MATTKRNVESNTYCAGALEIDLGGREVRCRGRRQPVQPKVFDLICYLLLRRYRVVAKEELLTELWPEEIVTDSSLTRCVWAARQALRSVADPSETIRTYWRRGYRFVLPVRRQGDVTSDDTVHQPASDSNPPIDESLQGGRRGIPGTCQRSLARLNACYRDLECHVNSLGSDAQEEIDLGLLDEASRHMQLAAEMLRSHTSALSSFHTRQQPAQAIYTAGRTRKRRG